MQVTTRRLCGTSINRLHALAPDKPIQISEMGSAEQGGSKADWIAGMFKFIASHPEIRSVIWFDVRKETDWTIESTRAASHQLPRSNRSLQLTYPSQS